MSTSIDLLAFGTFGIPNGFKQTFFLNNPNSRYLKSFDLNTNAITIYPKANLYSIRKEVANGAKALSYTQYSFAREQHSDRGGTFIGSSITFFNTNCEEPLVISCLDEFHADIIAEQRNIINNVLQVKHSDELIVREPKDLNKLDLNFKALDATLFQKTRNSFLVVYCDLTSELNLFLQKSAYLLSDFDTIYFTDSVDIANYVIEKGLYTFINSEQFLAEIEKRKAAKEIERFEQQKSKNTSFQKNKSTLPEKNTPEETAPRNWDMSIFQKKVNQNKLIAEHNDLVKKYNELKAQLKQLSSSKPKTDNPFESPDISYPEEEDSSILSSYQFWRGLSIILLLTCGYAGYREYERYNIVATIPTVAVSPAPPTPIPVVPPKVEIPPLNPLPKSVLKEKDIAYTFKNSTIQNQTADSVVNLIFAKNKTDITSIYGTQKPAYKAELIKRNPECFKDDKVICTSLKNIPSAK